MKRRVLLAALLLGCTCPTGPSSARLAIENAQPEPIATVYVDDELRHARPIRADGSAVLEVAPGCHSVQLVVGAGAIGAAIDLDHVCVDRGGLRKILLLEGLAVDVL